MHFSLLLASGLAIFLYSQIKRRSCSCDHYFIVRNYISHKRLVSPLTPCTLCARGANCSCLPCEVRMVNMRMRRYTAQSEEAHC